MDKFIPTQKLTVDEIGCHIQNVGDVLVQLDAHVTDDNSKIVIKPSQVPKLLVFLYDSLVDSLKECEDKDLVLDFGNSALSNTFEGVITTFINLFRDPKLYEQPNTPTSTKHSTDSVD